MLTISGTTRATTPSTTDIITDMMAFFYALLQYSIPIYLDTSIIVTGILALYNYIKYIIIILKI
jgi:hypothetical protein